MTFRTIQTTNLVSTETAFDDPLLILNKSGTVATDVGFLGKIGASNYAGLVRDSHTNKFILIDTITLNSHTVNDVNALDATLVKATLEVESIEASTVVPTTTFVLPKGTAANRPNSPVEAQLYFNTETKMFEGYNGTAWIQLLPSIYEVTP